MEADVDGRDDAAVSQPTRSSAEAARLHREGRAGAVELQPMDDRLRELDRLKADFLSMVSHELRTPLTAIIGYTDLLLRQVHGPLNERQVRHGQAVKKAAHRLLALINDVLDVGRLEGGEIELTTAAVPLAESFQRIVGDVRAAADERQLELRLDVPTPLPAVLADAERLHQILINLVGNAIKFSPTGGTVTVRAGRRGDLARICVSDNGVGIPAEQLGRIWDRFHQVDSSTRRRFGGTGLGLAIVRNLVELQGGAVEAHSDGPGLGSTFCFSLPLAETAPAAGSERAATPASPTPPAVAYRRRVLIVDDERDNREVIASIVSDVLGHEAILAGDGSEALARVEEGADLVLLDLRMPGPDGFEVARRLKAQPRTAKIPIVAITALAERGDQQDAIAAGCVGWVAKPFSEAELAEAIRLALSARPRSADAGA
jgi:signal transduction histidine kinase/CheY-like chemotaxis protein